MKEKLRAYSILFLVYVLLILTLSGGTLLSHLGFFDAGAYASCVRESDGTRLSFSRHTVFLSDEALNGVKSVIVRIGAVNRVYCPDVIVCEAITVFSVMKENYTPFLTLLRKGDFQKND